MTIKITSLSIDELALAQEVPVPLPLPRLPGSGIPLNPLIFSNDWGTRVSLETRWQTDVTRSASSGKPEKWSLASRPARVQTVRIVGCSREESHALLQSMLAHTGLLGVPVPIYSDVRTITGLGTKETSNDILYGDFRYRRFFRGGRVAIFPTKPTPDRKGTILAKIREIYSDFMVVSYEYLPLLRTPTILLDGVAPCIDVELVESASGVSRRDDIYEVSLTWREVEAESSLPGLWPPVRHDDPSILSSFCKTLDNLPIFPFQFDWSEGVSIGAARSIDSTPSGRSSIQEATGQTYQRFSVVVQGHRRDLTWDVLRFFDSMRGRAGTFYLIHPHRPWSLRSIPALDRVAIKTAGDAEFLRWYFNRAVLTRADGTMLTRTVSSTIDTGVEFILVFSSALPDDQFVDVQPIFECSFEQDSVTEQWANDEVVPALEFDIISEPSRGTVSISKDIAYQQRDHSFLTIPGNNLFLRAGAGGENFAWPANNSNLFVWKDSSSGPLRVTPDSIFPRFLTAAPGISRIPSLIRFPQQWQNNGEVAINGASFVYPNQLNPNIPVAEKTLWGPDGWTLLLCFTPRALSNDNRDLMVLTGSTGASLAVYCDRAFSPGASLGSRAGLRMVSPGPFTVHRPFLQRLDLYPYTVYVTLRWEGSLVRAWVNGAAAFVAPQSNPLPTIATYTQSSWFPGFESGLPDTAANIRNTFGVQGCANLVASYNRPLDIGEINQLHTLVSDIYRTTRQDSVLY